MYRAWDSLIIEKEADVMSVERIRRLKKARAAVSYFVVAGFILGAVAALGFTFSLVLAQLYLPGLCVLFLAASLFFAAYLFNRERLLDPIRNFLMNPKGFEALKGQLITATYNSSENRRNSRMLVEGEVTSSDGKKILFFESFSPDAWGEQRALPLPVYVLYDRRSRQAALLGIDRELLGVV
jgi:membrane protein implicated in regulation of membrane protease activity